MHKHAPRCRGLWFVSTSTAVGHVEPAENWACHPTLQGLACLPSAVRGQCQDRAVPGVRRPLAERGSGVRHSLRGSWLGLPVPAQKG